MKPKGYPKTPYVVTARNKSLTRGQQIWLFSSGNAYISETLVRDGYFEIRIAGSVNFEEVKQYLTQIEDFGV